VKGTVLLDGVPIADANVSIFPIDSKSMGNMAAKTDGQGRFTLNSSTQAIQPGRYIVLIVKNAASADAEEDGPPLPAGWRKNILPAKYFNHANPVFTVDLKPGGNTLAPFALTSQ
jgi:hypothetical protein